MMVDQRVVQSPKMFQKKFDDVKTVSIRFTRREIKKDGFFEALAPALVFQLGILSFGWMKDRDAVNTSTMAQSCRLLGSNLLRQDLLTRCRQLISLLTELHVHDARLDETFGQVLQDDVKAVFPRKRVCWF